MHYKTLIVAVAIIAGLLIAYAVWPKGVMSPVVTEQHVLSGTKSASGDYTYTEDAPYYTVKANYPATTGLSAEADAKARLAIEQSLAARITEFKKNSGVETMTAEDAAIQNLGGERKYVLDLEYKKFSSAVYVSYAYTVYEDTGGAHPNTYFLTFVFDQKGDRVALGTLFPGIPNWLEEVSLEVSNDVVAQYKARAEVDDTTGLIFAEGLAPKEENFSNFVIDGKDLVIYIPPYQVAAYAAGSFEVRLKPASLQ